MPKTLPRNQIHQYVYHYSLSTIINSTRRFCSRPSSVSFVAMGLNKLDAEIFSDALMFSELRFLSGQGQGVQRITTYFKRIQNKEVNLNSVMSNSFGFGGTNATLVFEKVKS